MEAVRLTTYEENNEYKQEPALTDWYGQAMLSRIWYFSLTLLHACMRTVLVQ